MTNEFRPILEISKKLNGGERVLFKQKDDHRVQHFLVVLDKAIETFFLYNAAAVGIQVTDFGFSELQKEFQKILKSQQIEDDEKYYALLKALRTGQTPDFVKINALLSQFL